MDSVVKFRNVSDVSSSSSVLFPLERVTEMWSKGKSKSTEAPPRSSSALYVPGWNVSLLMSSHRMDELINQPLRHVRLLNDALLVVLPNGAAQFIVVHRWTVFPDPPQFSYVCRVLDFKNSCTWEKKSVNLRSSDHGVIYLSQIFLLKMNFSLSVRKLKIAVMQLAVFRDEIRWDEMVAVIIMTSE